MSVTFGSVGDIIAICGIVRSLAQALNEVKGSSAEYQSVVQELRGLENALSEVESLSGKFSPQQQVVFQQCLHAAKQCRQVVEPFLETIEKYRNHLSEGGSSSPIKDAFFKARWHMSERDAVAKLRSEISSHTSTIMICLSAANLKTVNAQLGAFDRAQSLQMKATNHVDSQLAAGNSLLEECKSLLQRASSTLGLRWTQRILVDVRTTIGRVLSTAILTHEAVLKLQMTISPHADRCLFPQPWILEDPIGRITPVHTDFVNSWEAFEAVVESRFHNLPGFSKIQNREYVFNEPTTGLDVDPDLPWNAAFIPGRRYAMSMIFEEEISEDKKTETSCPRCHFIASVASNADTACERCGITYRRITEIDDETDVAIQIQSQPILSKRGRRNIKRALQRHKPGNKTQQSGSTEPLLSSKRKKCPTIQEEDCMNHFKRIRLFSRTTSTGQGSIALSSCTSNDPTPEDTTVSPASTSSISRTVNCNIDTIGRKDDDIPKEAGTNATQDKPPGNRLTESDDDALLSLSSSIFDYEFDNERRYHAYKAGTYLLPNDDNEIDLLDLLHHVVRSVMSERLFDAPVTTPQRVLDVGCGTGIWAIECAEMFEGCSVQGIDLSPIQPSWLPSNCQFVVEDLTDYEDFIHRGFECSMIHARNLSTAIKDWPAFLDKAFRSLEEGGYIEIQDLVFSPVCSTAQDIPHMLSAISLFCDTASEAFSKLGHDLTVMSKMESMMSAAGFQEVTVHEYMIEIGHTTRLEQLMRFYLLESADGLSNKPFRDGLGMEEEARQTLMQDFKTAVKRVKRGLKFKYVTMYGRKT